MRPRCIYAWRIKDEDITERIDELINFITNKNYDFNCGDNLFGIEEDPIKHDSSLDIFYVKTNLQCFQPMEKAYFTKKIFISTSMFNLWFG